MKHSGTDAGSHSWLRSANCDGRYGGVLLGVSCALLAPCAGGSAWRDRLSYERLGLEHGQYWRLLTAHLVHLGTLHALLNVAGLALLWVMFAREYSARRWALIALAAVAAIDAGLWFLRPQLQWYLGASGLLHGVFAAGAAAQLRRGEGSGAAWLLLLLIKLAHDQISGASLWLSSLPAATDAHLFGALGGLAAAWLTPRARQPL